jgi:hypothetical protein
MIVRRVVLMAAGLLALGAMAQAVALPLLLPNTGAAVQPVQFYEYEGEDEEDFSPEDDEPAPRRYYGSPDERERPRRLRPQPPDEFYPRYGDEQGEEQEEALEYRRPRRDALRERQRPRRPDRPRGQDRQYY